MEKPIRVLQIVTHMNRGGLETMLMNYYRHIDRNKIQFDFLTHRSESEKKDYDDEIRNLGGRIYHVPVLNPFSNAYFDALRKFFDEHREYKIVHCHLDCMSAYPLKIAKEYGVPVRIAHAHTSKVEFGLKGIIKLYSKTMIAKFATELFACSELAGNWMYGNQNYNIFYNAIDVERFQFDLSNREALRKEWNIDDDVCVLGHVGNFTPPKNHDFLIKLFDDYNKQKKCILVLVGAGNRKMTIEALIQKKKISDRIILLGRREDVHRILSAIDIFLFPSLYEGFPVSLIEAQASGLKCLVSKNVTSEAKVLDNLVYIDLNDKALWMKELELNNDREIDAVRKIKEHGFDIKQNAKWLEEYYINAYR